VIPYLVGKEEWKGIATSRINLVFAVKRQYCSGRKKRIIHLFSNELLLLADWNDIMSKSKKDYLFFVIIFLFFICLIFFLNIPKVSSIIILIVTALFILFLDYLVKYKNKNKTK